MKPRVFKSNKEIDKFLTKNGYNWPLAQEEGWHLCSNDDMTLEICAVVEPDDYRPASCKCANKLRGYKIPSCTACFAVGYQYVPPKVAIFPYDADAINFVFQQALYGSKRHQFAIQTHFGTKEFYPFSVIEYGVHGCHVLRCFKNEKVATREFAKEISAYGLEPTDKCFEDGFVDIEGGFRVVLIAGGPRKIQ